MNLESNIKLSDHYKNHCWTFHFIFISNFFWNLISFLNFISFIKFIICFSNVLSSSSIDGHLLEENANFSSIFSILALKIEKHISFYTSNILCIYIYIYIHTHMYMCSVINIMLSLFINISNYGEVKITTTFLIVTKCN